MREQTVPGTDESHSSDGHWWTKTKAIWAGALAVVTACSTVVGLTVDIPALAHNLMNEGTITFGIPGNSIVNRCLELAGTAPHIDGMVLREAHYSSQRQFYFNTPVVENGDRWRMRMVVGQANTEQETAYFIQLYYLPSQTADFVDNLDIAVGSEGTKGQIFAKSLPPGAEHAKTLTVIRRKETNAPAC
jgi:hypothetical protein